MLFAALEFCRELCTIQSRCNGVIVEQQFLNCQEEDVAGERVTAEDAENAKKGIS